MFDTITTRFNKALIATLISGSVLAGATSQAHAGGGEGKGEVEVIQSYEPHHNRGIGLHRSIHRYLVSDRNGKRFWVDGDAKLNRFILRQEKLENGRQKKFVNKRKEIQKSPKFKRPRRRAVGSIAGAIASALGF